MFALSVQTLLMSNLDPATQGWLSLNEFSAKVKSAYRGPLNIIHHNISGVNMGITMDYSRPPPPEVDWRTTGKLTPVRQSR